MELVTVKKRVLRFSLHRPSDSAMISDTLDVTNVTADFVAFKVKTTNQERYIVRPNVNTIPPHATVSIFIGVQPLTDLPPPGPSKDKFLLRVLQSPDQPDLPTDFWNTNETHPDVQGLKFKVEFGDAPPSSSIPAVADHNNNNNNNDNDNNNDNNHQHQHQHLHLPNPNTTHSPPPLQTHLVASQPLASSSLANHSSSPTAALTPPAVVRAPAVPDLKAPAPPAPALLSETRQRVDFSTAPAPIPAHPHARDLPPDLGPATPSAAPAPAHHQLQQQAHQGAHSLSTAGAPSGALLPGPATASTTSSVRAAAAAASGAPAQESLSDAQELLQDDRYVEAMERVAKLQAQLDERNLELARLKAELLETRAETDRVLKDAPTAPFAVNKIVSDPFGGASIAAVGLMLLLFAIIVNFIFRR